MQLLTESHAGGILNGLSVNSTFNNRLQRESLELKNGAQVLQSAGYTYDTAGRLQTVTNGSYSATYAYHPNSSLINIVTFRNGEQTRLVTTRNYDRLNRLQSISSVASGSSAPSLPISYAYQYNRANQRTRVTLADASYWVYQYDALGQVISGKKYWSDGTPVAGQQSEYGFDDIGNRVAAKAGGDENGNVLRPATYTPNRLNQYSQRTVPGAVDVLGIANVGASIQVNSSTNGVYRRGEYFRKDMSVNNTNNGAVWQSVEVRAQRTGYSDDLSKGNQFVPPAQETFAHDADGNLTADGRWTYTWDAENRLLKMESQASAPTESKRRLTFVYDHQGRRIEEAVQRYTNSAWTIVLSNRFLYDGWNLLAELNATNNAVVRSYLWGLDLSGSLQGAGGVGGLLTISNQQSSVHFAGYDGNGNLTLLVNAADGSDSARYEYGPFAEPIRATAPMAKANPFRFSTKYTDDESDLLYYGYRYLSASTGRWLSRDPIEERGGLNLYGFVRSNPPNEVDPYGLDWNHNTVFRATCDLCDGGPKLGAGTKTLRDWRWHVWGRVWQKSTIRIYIPGTDIHITPPWHVPGSGGYWVIAGGWVVVDATCGIPSNAWTLSDFIVTAWGSIGPDMKPSVKCKYTCNYNKDRTASLPGAGSMGAPPLQREDNSSEKDGSPPIFW